MGNIYHSIMEGLSEAIEDAQSGGKKLKRRVVSVVPVKEYNVKENRVVPKTLCRLYGGPKTVEAWEAGTNHPSGTASRILNMMEMNDNLIINFPFVKV